MVKEKKKGGFRQKTLHENLFAFSVLFLFVLQFIVFWVYANINNIMLAFQKYDAQSNEFKFFAWDENIFSNFARVFKNIFGGSEKYGLHAILNGAYFHVLTSFVCLPFSYMIAFILYKKLPATGFFKVVLYLPAILSSMVTVWIFRYMVEVGIGGIYDKAQGLSGAFPAVFKSPVYNRFVVSFYVIFFGLPGSLLINLGSMSRVPQELIEYGELEGISLWKEFILVTVPMIFPVLQVQCLGLFSGFFTNQGPLFTFYAKDAPSNLATFGYNLFISVVDGDTTAAKMSYGYNTAVSLTIGLISVPIVQATKWLFDKLDPGAEF